MRRRRRWILAVVLAALAAGLWMAARMAGPWLQDAARLRLQAEAAALTGCSVGIEDLRLDLLSGRAEALGVSVDCGEAGHLVVPRLRAKVALRPLLARRLSLQRLQATSPELRWRGPAPGWMTGSHPGADGDEPDVAGAWTFLLGRLELTGGQAAWQDGSGDWSVSLRDLALSSARLWDGQRLQLAVETGIDGRTPLADLAGAHLAGALAMEDQRLLVTSLRAEAPDATRLAGEGSVDWSGAGEPEIRFRGSADAPAALVRALAPLPEGILPGAPLHWEGEVEGAGRRWTVRGDAATAEVSLYGLRLQDIQGLGLDISTAGRLSGRLQAAAMDGRLAVNLGDAGPEPWTLEGRAELAAIDLGEWPEAWPWPDPLRRPETRITADVNGRLPLTGPASAGAGGWLAFNPSPTTSGSWAPSGRLEGSLADGLLHVKALDMAQAEMRISGQGRFGLDGSMEARSSISSGDMAATVIRLADRNHYPIDPLLLPSGQVQIDVGYTGSLYRPLAVLSVQADDLSWRMLPLGRLEAALEWKDGELRVQSAELAGPLAEAELSGAWDINGLSRLGARIERVDLALLAGAAGLSGAACGTLQGDAELTRSGTEARLEVAIGGSDLELAGRPVDSARLEASLNGTGLELGALELRREGGRVWAAGSLPWVLSDADAAAGISVDADRVPLSLLAGMSGLAGRVSLGGRVRSGLLSPEPEGRFDLRLENTVAAGWQFPDVAGVLDLQGGRARLELAATAWPLEALLTWDWAGDGLARLEMTGGGLRLPIPGEVADLELAADGLQVEVTLDPVAPFDLDAVIAIDGMALETPAGPATVLEPVRVVAAGGFARLEPITVRFGSEELTLMGEAELAAAGPAPTWRLQAIGLTDVSRWQFLVPATRLAGTAMVEARMEGVGTDWHLYGDMSVQGGYLRLDGFPNAIEQIDARAVLEGDRVVLQRLKARIGGGYLEGHGELTMDRWRPVAYRLEWSGERIATRYPRGVRSVADLDLVLQGRPGEALLSGRVDIRQARYSEPFNIERRLLARVPPPLPPPPGLLDHILLDLTLDAPGQLWIDNDFAKAEFMAELRIRGSAARPIPEGVVELVRTGRLTFRDVQYQVVEGALSFAAQAPNDPDLNVLARTDINLYRVSLQVTGPISEPRIDLSSDPELAQDEIVVLLLVGSLPEDNQQVRVSSETVAGYLGGALLPANALRGLGIDEARIDPVFVEGQGDPTARLTLTERISSKLTASWSTTLGGVQGDTVELRYRVKPHIELRTAQEETGASVVEGRYVRSFRSKMQRRAATEIGPPRPEGRVTRRLLLGPILISGAPTPPGEEAVREVMGLSQGQQVERGEVFAAAAAARDLLLGMGFRLARVGCESAEPDADGRSMVECTISSGPVLKLQLEGVRRKKDRRGLEEAIQDEWMEVLAEGDLLDAAAAAAEDFYREKGHASARATASLVAEGEGPPNTVEVRIEPGPRVRVTEVRLEGLGDLDEKEVRSHLLATGRVVVRRSLLTPELVQDDRETLVRLFAGYGYLDVMVPEPEVVLTTPDEATLIFRVDPGQRRLLSSVQFTGAEAVGEERLQQAMLLHPGERPDPGRLEESALAVRRLYDSLGYPDAVVFWRLERDNGGARVLVEVREGPQVKVGEVRIEGLGVTVDRVVRREVTLEPGAPFQREELVNSQRQVRDLGLFRSVVVEGKDAPGVEGVRDVVVRVKERDALDLAAGLGFDNEEGVRVSFSVGNRNLRGKGGTFSFQSRFSGRLESGEVRNGWRRVGGSRNDLLGAASLRSLERQGFTEQRLALVTQLSRPLNRKTTLQLRYRIEDVALSDVTTFDLASPTLLQLGPEVLEEGLLGSLGTSIVRRTVDDALNPLDGGLRTIDLSVYNDALGSEFEYARLFFQQGRFWSFARDKLVFSSFFRGGFMWPYGATSVVPLSERFFAGGISSVRGYEQDRLGPRNPETNEPVGGESIFVMNNELRIGLTDSLAARLFLDAGNVYLRAQDLDFSGLKFTVGPGFSVATPVGPLRFYYGYKLNREPWESAGRFHITFGIAF